MQVKNPYSDLLKIMREQGAKDNPPSIRLGTVLAPPPAIRIQTGDLVLDADDLLIADYLLPNYQREYSQTGEGTIITKTPPSPVTYSSYTVMESLTDTGQITFTDTLKSGDIVALLATEDRQTYILLCKVVNVGG